MHPSMAKLPVARGGGPGLRRGLHPDRLAARQGRLRRAAPGAHLPSATAAARSGRSAEAVDKRWLQVERDWQAHLRTLDLGAGKAAGVPRQAARIRFAKGGAGSDNVGLDEIASAKARKFARLGGMLRARGSPPPRPSSTARRWPPPAATIRSSPASWPGSGSSSASFDKAIALAEPLAAVDDTDPVPAVTLGLARAGQGDTPARSPRSSRRCGSRRSIPPCAAAWPTATIAVRPRAARERAACNRVCAP
jgi:hypothetical protein